MKYNALPATTENLRLCFSLMDLTSLRTEDTEASIAALVEKFNAFPAVFPDCPLPAGLCVFPNFVTTVKAQLKVPVRIVAVSGSFPTAQTFDEVKALETKMAKEAGADEVDFVWDVNHFLAGDEKKAGESIGVHRRAVNPDASAPRYPLKVILETGMMNSPEDIFRAARIAIDGGADFIKTSTGKIAVGATPEAAEAMCRAIRESGEKVGFKAAGGISTVEDALLYAGIVREILGSAWLNPARMRLGVSRLANKLLSALYGREIVYF